MEDIETYHVNLKLRKKTLSPTDTPHSINYKVTDYIGNDICVLNNIYYKMSNKVVFIRSVIEKKFILRYIIEKLSFLIIIIKFYFIVFKKVGHTWRYEYPSLFGRDLVNVLNF